MKNSINLANSNIGISYSGFLLAYEKEANKILKKADGNIFSVFEQAFEHLEKRDILNQDETKILLQCFTETIKTGKDRTTSKKAIAFLQNTYSKAIIEGNVNILFLNLIDLSTKNKLFNNIL